MGANEQNNQSVSIVARAAVLLLIVAALTGGVLLWVWANGRTLSKEDKLIVRVADDYADHHDLTTVKQELDKLDEGEQQIIERASELAEAFREDEQIERADKLTKLAADLRNSFEQGAEVTGKGMVAPPVASFPTATPVATASSVCAALDNAWTAGDWENVIDLLTQNQNSALACPLSDGTTQPIDFQEKLFAAHYNYCYELVRQGRTSEATEQCQRAAAIKPGDELASEFINNVRTGKVVVACAELQNAWDTDNWVDAIQLLRQVRDGDRVCGNINVNDYLFAAHVNYGYAYLSNQQWAQAEQECKAALEYRPQDIYATRCVQAATAKMAPISSAVSTPIPAAPGATDPACAEFEQAWNASDWARVVEIGTQIKDGLLQCDHIDWRNKLYAARVSYGQMLMAARKWEDALTQCQFAMYEKPDGAEALECLNRVKMILTPAQ